jgi:chromosome segregation ATPase
LGLLERAAGMAEKNIQHAVGVAQKLSQELQSAEQRIRELEEDVRYYRDKADRAERWLRHISSQIEQRFFAATNKPPQ